MKSINESACQLLDQISIVLGQLATEDFAKPLAILNGSSIGQHVRHTLEFFQCLEDAQTDGELNYDLRKHDQNLQEDLRLASDLLCAIQSSINARKANFQIKLHASYDIEDDVPMTLATSYHRELAYNIEHAVHHMALIKIGLKNISPTIQIPTHFGVASSTVKYMQAQRT